MSLTRPPRSEPQVPQAAPDSEANHHSSQSEKTSLIPAFLRRHNMPIVPSFSSIVSPSQKDKEAHPSQSHLSLLSSSGVGGVSRIALLHEYFIRVIYSGLTNRGVMVDYCFPMDAAVKVLHDDAGASIDNCITLTAAEPIIVESSSDAASPEPHQPKTRYQHCEAIVKELIKAKLLAETTNAHHAGLFKEIGLKNHHAFSAPIEERLKVLQIERPSAKMPVNPFVPQHYHRHLAIAHILTEKTFMSKRMAEHMSALQVLWSRKISNPTPELAMQIVHSVLQLMSISNYCYGSRVPDYSLRREAMVITPEVAAAHCDPKKRVQSSQDGMKFAGAVRANLTGVVEHLMKRFESMFIVEVDPDVWDRESFESALLEERFSNRSGLVSTGNGEAAVFTTKLTYCVLPIRTAIEELLNSKKASASSEPSSPTLADDTDISGGLILIEVGFNYVNYAIDMYIATDGTSQVPHGLLAEAVCYLRSRIQFSSVVYDFIVQRLFSQVHKRTAVLPGQQYLTQSLANIVKYNPSPPRYSYNQLVADDVTSLLSQAHRKGSALELKDNLSFVPAYGTEGCEDVIRFVVPPSDAPEVYKNELNQYMSFRFVGLLAWETVKAEGGQPTRRATLYTLVVYPDTEAPVTGDVDAQHSTSHKRAIGDARSKLLDLIQSSDEQVLVDSLWRKVKRGLRLSEPGYVRVVPRMTPGSTARACPSLSIDTVPLPTTALSAAARLSDLVSGLESEDNIISWDDMATLERYITRIEVPSSAYLLDTLREATHELSDGPLPPACGWIARVPSSAEANSVMVSLSLPEAICAYLRDSVPSQTFLSSNNICVHIAEPAWEPGQGPLRTRIVFAPQQDSSAETLLANHSFATSATHRGVAQPESANFLVVVDISREVAKNEDSGRWSLLPFDRHSISSISIWREGFGAYEQASAELGEPECAFLDNVHSYVTAVLWAGFRGF
eukprot:GILJ01014954.1.p1 GENE.GILJ01014954.1~~GILJ01014954.1.p1  ORF type:complete len:1113 (+),score=160.53 GILJ01014954.1:473-3340(+)